MKNVAVGERIRWKLSFASEDIEDVYLEEELIETDSRRAFHEDPAKLRGLKSKKINPAFIKIEFTCRVAPSSLDDSQRPKSSVGDQMETSEDISGISSIFIIIFRYEMLTMKEANSAARSANLPIAKFDFASLGVRRIRLEFRRAEKVKGLKMWNWPAVLYFLGGGKNKWQPDYGREMQEEVLTRDLTHLKELSLYEQILQPFESGFKLLTCVYKSCYSLNS